MRGLNTQITFNQEHNIKKDYLDNLFPILNENRNNLNL
jgi:hypothetical protein